MEHFCGDVASNNKMYFRCSHKVFDILAKF